jgi:hypothetical protein
VRQHLPDAELDRLFDPANYSGEAGAFVDRVLASYERNRHHDNHNIQEKKA